MALDDYNPLTSRDAYYPQGSDRPARLWSVEKFVQDAAAAGLLSIFEGAGTDPTVLTGYAVDKVWLRAAAGVQATTGEARAYLGTGDASLLASWPVLDRAGLRRHLSVYSKAEVNALIIAGLPPGFGSDDVPNESAVAGGSVSAALNTLSNGKVSTSALGTTVATLTGGTLTPSQIPASLTSALKFHGTWNATTNSPPLVSSVGTEGLVYRVSVAGTTALDGEASWQIGDELYFGGGVWNKLSSSAVAGAPSALAFANIDGRIVKRGKTNGGGSAKYQAAVTADGRLIVCGDTASFAFNPVGDRYAWHEIPLPWDTATVTIEEVWCGLNYILVQTSEATANLWHLGSSNYGQGGNGVTTAATALTRVSGLTGIKISAVTTEANRGNVEAFWFARTSLGRIYSCGYSGAQQTMGYNSTTNLMTPRLMTYSDGTTPVTDVDNVICDTAYAPVWARLTTGKAVRWGAGTDGAHGNNNATAMTWPDALETSPGSGIDRTDIALIQVAGSAQAVVRAITWLLTTAGKIEVSGSRAYGNGDGAALLGAAVTTFQPAAGAIDGLTVSNIIAGGGEYNACLAITSTGQGYIAGYMASYAQRGDGLTANLNTFSPLVNLPAGFAGALTGAVIAGGNSFTTVYLEATIAGAKVLASIGYDGQYQTAKGTAATPAASQTWGRVQGLRGAIVDWGAFGTHQEFGLAILTSDGELRYAGANDQGQGGVTSGQVLAIDTLQAVRTGLPRVLKTYTPRGAYSSITTYSKNDVVLLLGTSWRYIGDVPTAGNLPPTLPTTENTYWQAVATRGEDGVPGPNTGYSYLWDTGTADANPGVGVVRINHATPASATWMYISKTDNLGNNLDAEIGGWDDSTSVERAVLTLFQLSSHVKGFSARIAAGMVDGTTYWKVPLSSVVARADGAPGPAGQQVSIAVARKGDKGDLGNPGPGNSLAIGTVTTGAPGSSAAASVTGASPAQTLNLTIPQGPVGVAGPGNSLAIGTVTTGAAGSAASAAITGASPSQTLSLTIPQGIQGSPGTTVPDPSGLTRKLIAKAADRVIIGDADASFGFKYGEVRDLVPLGEANGRLTLVSNTPIMTTNQAGASTIFWTPYKGAFVPLWDGTAFRWVNMAAELSQALSDTTKSPAAAAADSSYDLLAWLDGTTPRVTRSAAWSSATSRGTGAGTPQIERLVGIDVNMQAVTNGPAARFGTLVGTIMTNASSLVVSNANSQAMQSGGRTVGLCNRYNTVELPAYSNPVAANWTYASSTIREASGASHRVEFVQCLAEHRIPVTYFARAVWSAGTPIANITVSLDSVTAVDIYAGMRTGAASLQTSGSGQTISSGAEFLPQLGRHYIAAIETVSGGTVLFVNDGGAVPYLNLLTVRLRV